MKTYIKLLFWMLVIITALKTLNANNNPNSECNILHKGVFKYGEYNNEVTVIIKRKKHIEYHNGGKYIIKSKIVWVNDCEYNMTMTKTTVPNFPYGKGDVMNVKINKVDGRDIYYTSTVEENSWEGKLTKVK